MIMINFRQRLDHIHSSDGQYESVFLFIYKLLAYCLILGVSIIGTSVLLGCEQARRVDLSTLQDTSQRSALEPNESDDLGQTEANSNSENGMINIADVEHCEGESLWSRLSPRRYRPLTRSEIEQTWIRLLTSEADLSDSSANTPCTPYLFEVSREQLGEYRSAQVLHIASELNNWAGTLDAGGWPLSLSEDGLYWRLERSLPAGRHPYKIVIDEQHWLTDPNNLEREGDGFGGENSVAVIECDLNMRQERGRRSEALATISSALRGFPVTPRPAHYPFRGHVQSFQISSEHVIALLDASQTLISLLPNVLGERIACVREHSSFAQLSLDLDGRLAGIDRDCLVEILDLVGAHLHRKSLTESTRTRALNLALNQSISVALRVLALSPEALYRAELGTLKMLSPEESSSFGIPTEERVYALSSNELASALSFALWGGPPDAELSRLGEQGALYELETLRAQAERLLNHPWALDHWGQVGVEWLGVEEALRSPKRSDLFPQLSNDIREAMIAEVSALVSTALLADGSILNFADFIGLDSLFGVNSPETEHDELRWLNDELIEYYQLDSARMRPASYGEWSESILTMGDSFRFHSLSPYWVEVSERGTHSARGGILGAGATLLTYAHSDQTSPILRGLFVRERLLCQTFGPPPPNAGGVPEVNPDATTRERFRQHSDDPSCSACHRLIDEVGFGFEGFDAAGGSREQEAGMPVDTHGMLAGLNSLGDPDEYHFVGLKELAELLAHSDQTRSCLLTQLRRTTLGAMSISNGVESTSVMGEGEACHLKALRTRFISDEISVREAIIELILSPEFRLRREAPEEDR